MYFFIHALVIKKVKLLENKSSDVKGHEKNIYFPIALLNLFNVYMLKFLSVYSIDCHLDLFTF